MQIEYIICPEVIEEKLAKKSVSPMPANKSSVSKAKSLEKMGEFWDKHDFTEFDDPNRSDVEGRVNVAISIEPDLLSDIEELAHLRGIEVETLVNLWLKEKIIETKAE